MGNIKHLDPWFKQFLTAVSKDLSLLTIVWIEVSTSLVQKNHSTVFVYANLFSTNFSLLATVRLGLKQVEDEEFKGILK